MNKIFVVGIGPGKEDFMTIEAKKAIENSEIIVGYTKYIELVKPVFPQKEFFQTGMMKEAERCKKALEFAQSGKTTSIVCSGDSCIYGMASLVLELSVDFPETEIEIVAGVTAAISGGAVLGSPLTCDFCVISLSDLLTPKETIEKRLKAAALGDFVTVLYNPKSKNRSETINEAVKILLQEKNPETVCAVIKNIGRENTDFIFCTLSELPDLSQKGFEIDMFSTVFIGNSKTKLIEHSERKYMVNPRGYLERT